MPMNLSGIAILNINGANYGCIISGIRRGEVINLRQKIYFIEKCGTLENIKLYNHI